MRLLGVPGGLLLVVSMGRWIKVGQGRKLLLDFGLLGNWSHSAGGKICKFDSFTNLKSISMTLHALSINPKFLINLKPTSLKHQCLCRSPGGLFKILILIWCVTRGLDSALMTSILVGWCHWSADDILYSKDQKDPSLSGSPTSGVPPLSLSVQVASFPFFEDGMLPLDSSLWICSFFYPEFFFSSSIFSAQTPMCLLPSYSSSRIYLQTHSKTFTFPSQHFTQFVCMFWSCVII